MRAYVDLVAVEGAREEIDIRLSKKCLSIAIKKRVKKWREWEKRRQKREGGKEGEERGDGAGDGGGEGYR